LLTKRVVIIPKSEQPGRLATSKDPTAPKRPRGRPKKDASAHSGAQPAASESSDDELEVEDEIPQRSPLLYSLYQCHPTERGKVLYRAVQAVWSPRNKSVDAREDSCWYRQLWGYGSRLEGCVEDQERNPEKGRTSKFPNRCRCLGVEGRSWAYRQLLETVMLKSLQ